MAEYGGVEYGGLSSRHFRGQIALLQVFNGDLAAPQAEALFTDGEATLSLVLAAAAAPPNEAPCGCVFPFSYNGRTYSDCTDTDHVQLWCPLAVDQRGVYISGGALGDDWGNCAEVCPVFCASSDDCDAEHYCSDYDFPTLCSPCHACAGRDDAVEYDCPEKCEGSTAWDNELVADCGGNWAPVDWVGDGHCDAGEYEYFGRPVQLNCVETDYDGGDCDGEDLSGISYISDCFGNPAPESLLGDGYKFCHNIRPFYRINFGRIIELTVDDF